MMFCLRNDDLVLMDGGCEFNGYVCDITRTWPINGKFSQSQKQLYQIVLRVQLDCIKVRVLILVASLW